MTEWVDQLAKQWEANPDAPSTISLCNAVRGPLHADVIERVGEAARSRHAQNVPVLVAVARMYASAQRFADAQAALVAAGKVAPRDSTVYRVLGEILLRRGDAERASKVLERALSFGATDSETRLWLDRARVFLPMQKAAGARAVAAEVERTDPAASAGGREPMESISDSTTDIRPMPPGVNAQPLFSPRPPPVGAPPGPGGAPGSSSKLPAVKPPPLLAPDVGGPPRYSKEAATATHVLPIGGPSPAPPPAARAPFALPADSPPPSDSLPNLTGEGPTFPTQEDSVTFDLGENGPPEDETLTRRPDFEDPDRDGHPPDPRRVLNALAFAGIFEPDTATEGAEPVWARPDVPRRWKSSAFLIGLTVLLLILGGTTYHVIGQRRAANRAVASGLLDEIDSAMMGGRPSDLPAVEERFERVFELDSRSDRAALAWARERALVGLLKGGEDVAFETAISRAREVGVEEDKLAFALIASFLFQGDTAGAASVLPRYDAKAKEDAWYQLMAGAALERAGDSRALERYERAVKLEPRLVVAQIARARATAIDGDAEEAAQLAKAFRKQHPKRPESAALVALAWARQPVRPEQAPKEANETLTQASLLPLSLAAIPHAIAAIRALDRHSTEEAKASLQQGLRLAVTPGTAAWLGMIALSTGDEALARRAALTAVAFSAVYPPARVLAARVALLGDRIDEAMKATESLDATSPDVATVRAIVAYETLNPDGLGRALAPIQEMFEHPPVPGFLLGVGAAPAALVGEPRPTREASASLAKSEAPWADVIAVDIALDRGDLELAHQVADTWDPKSPGAVRAIRLSRLSRYDERMDDADRYSTLALSRAGPLPRAILERVFVLATTKRAKDVDALLAKYPLALGPVSIWASAFAAASQGDRGRAKAKVATVDPPPALAPLLARQVAASALGAMRDHGRGPEYTNQLVGAGIANPDMRAAGKPFGIQGP